MSARSQLLDMIGKDDPYSMPARDIAALQLAAAQERFEEMRGRVRVLDRRAKDTGVERVETLADVVPLLFAHSNYKSYPDSVVRGGKWGHLLTWLGTLAAIDLSGADMTDVTDLDDFVDRVNATGALILCTSGTSGKTSFLIHSGEDRRILKDISNTYFGWPFVSPIPQDQGATVVQMAPSRGHSYFVESYWRKVGTFASPENAHSLDTEFRISEINAMGAMRKAMSAGTVSPEQIAAFEEESAKRAARTKAALDRLTDITLASRGKRLILGGTYVHLFQIVEAARERGLAPGGWEGTVIGLGGGLKGSSLPPDYATRVSDFFAGATLVQTYGMSEMSTHWPKCEVGNYHRPPWIIPLILNHDGTELVEPVDGHLDGRFAFLDLVIDGRWGGLITGDHVQMTIDGCACARPGPHIADPIARFADTGDDKLSCAGTIDSYIRGFVTEQ